ncbi:hypothetical protein WN66_06784 (mitochondrion) [Saccharomyces cerevisiae]|uniref:Putative uncharacterized protein Q0092, mitochondrial n=1 Tax=Saccharomyces cerevisiae (strain ATCC 204508 / S288c) TaxID=559292 RepID=Q0092_YEAST|nr:RecName: Full=Putative uncharacterized protein Q0092, mitochondrial [Saccharomyces cerevisiae S288C]AAA32161.2 ORF5 peptide (put.; ata start codon); putative [Saccharomyces cerevisiae]KZV07219.1 hypothetical protein WN66_06784 [Saccharomyces cerevisiae]prf//1110191A ORF 5 [Saccharomyces cerevisiae]
MFMMNNNMFIMFMIMYNVMRVNITRCSRVMFTTFYMITNKYIYIFM